MPVWVEPLITLVIAVMTFAVAFGVMRAKVQAIQHELDQLTARFDRSDDKHDSVMERVNEIAVNVGILAGLANATESLRQRRTQ